MTVVEEPTLPVEVPLVVTSEVGTEIMAKTDRGDTSYTILMLNPVVLDDAENPVEQEYWNVEEEALEARSAETAIRKFAASVTAETLAKGLTLVAVPSRSWKPVRIKPQTVTTLVLEDA